MQISTQMSQSLSLKSVEGFGLFSGHKVRVGKGAVNIQMTF